MGHLEEDEMRMEERKGVGGRRGRRICELGR
jgi:hypothetical protein